MPIKRLSQFMHRQPKALRSTAPATIFYRPLKEKIPKLARQNPRIQQTAQARSSHKSSRRQNTNAARCFRGEKKKSATAAAVCKTKYIGRAHRRGVETSRVRAARNKRAILKERAWCSILRETVCACARSTSYTGLWGWIFFPLSRCFAFVELEIFSAGNLSILRKELLFIHSLLPWKPCALCRALLIWASIITRSMGDYKINKNVAE